VSKNPRKFLQLRAGTNNKGAQGVAEKKKKGTEKKEEGNFLSRVRDGAKTRESKGTQTAGQKEHWRGTLSRRGLRTNYKRSYLKPAGLRIKREKKKTKQRRKTTAGMAKLPMQMAGKWENRRKG